MFSSLLLFQNYSLYSVNCVLGRFWTFSNLDVLFTATLGESCANPARNCMGNTECSGSGFCVCSSDYVLFGSTCVYAFGWWMTFWTFIISYVVFFSFFSMFVFKEMTRVKIHHSPSLPKPQRHNMTIVFIIHAGLFIRKTVRYIIFSEKKMNRQCCYFHLLCVPLVSCILFYVSARYRK